MRWRRVAVLSLPALALTALVIRLLFPPHSTPLISIQSLERQLEEWRLPPPPKGKAKPADSRSHPIEQLVQEATSQFDKVKTSQSRSLSAAVDEYKRRYGLHPPPNFDKWYEFAKKNGVKMIDDYDTIYHSLLPFWAIQPKTLRTRVAEAIGYEGNAFIAVIIRNGQIVKVQGGGKLYKWQTEVTREMIEPFVQYLPDMDLAFNIHDEPRVIIPHDELALMVDQAAHTVLPEALAAVQPVNAFSPRPSDMSDGSRIKEKKTSRFNEYAHQAVWVTSRMSCPLDSPARNYDDGASDILSGYAFGDLDFIRNETSYSDICMAPSLRNSFGFFERPNSFKVSQELIPVFSQSKVNTYQDILYPSPWYVYGKRVTGQAPSKHKPQYDEKREQAWEAKQDAIWWRGSTTGGYSRSGGWRRQHRQRFVRKLNAPDQAKILVDENRVSSEDPDGVGSHHDTSHSSSSSSVRASTPDWRVRSVARRDYGALVDVKFSHVGQCDAGDCAAQREFFEIVPPADSQDAWGYKFLLDIDGNAFSGRFYAFLKSRSLPFKAALFREWHHEWLRPWVHYVPLSLRGEDALEAVRFLAHDEDAGRQLAHRLAENGRLWATQVLRNVDLEAWLFRLLLEYGRVLDDERMAIGFSL